MSTIKKLLALVLALTMVLSVSAAAAYSVVPYGDAEAIAEGAEVAVKMLYNMGIMKGDNKGNFNPEATITRAEVAKMIYVILNYGEDDLAKNYTGGKFFSDVESGLWYEGYINYAATTKLVQGRPDGTFGPNDPVTCAEAAKMLLTAIGYSAEARGYVGAGWDKQVLSDASIIGLLDGYDYNTNTYAPRQWVAVMFKNALTDALTYSTIAPVVFNGLLTGINTDYQDYETMGEKYFNLKYTKGVVTANEYANLEDGEKVLSSGRTELDFSGTNLKVGTKLTDVGERREAYYNTENNAVYYFGDYGTNVTFSTGAATEIVKKYIDGIKLDSDTEYFLNFESSKTIKEGYETGNGDWLKVVDYNDDGYAEYVFVTEFEMTEVDYVAKNDTVFLLNDKSSDEYRMSTEVEGGDIVLYTKIDNKEYVELADNFTGKVDKYTYKTRTLTVAGEDYPQSDIDYASIDEYYFGVLEDAAKKTEYTYYQDFFGNVRIFTRSKADSGDLVLLTDAFYASGRKGSEAAVEAYINGEITEVDVDWDTTYTNVRSFIDGETNKNAWGLLKEYIGDKFVDADGDGKWDIGEGAWTNIARTSIDEDGVMSLYTAQTHKYNAKGEQGDIKADYVDLDEVDVDGGDTAYAAKYDGKATTVYTTKNTVFYYVDSDLDIVTVTGYKNTFDVVNEYVGINAMYAVATDTSKDAADGHYWVADVIVIETEYPVFNLGKNVVLGYNVVNKTVSDYASLDVIGGDAALDNLNVTNYNGYNSFEADEIETPAFYFNTEDEDGDSHIRIIDTDAGYKANNIVAGKINMVNKLLDYVVLTDAEGTYYYDENTVIYDMYEGRRHIAVTAEDDYEDAFEFETKEEYILVADDDNNIIFAIWVEATYTDDDGDVVVDPARALFEQITDPAGTAADKAAAAALAKAKADAKAEVAKRTWADAYKAAANKAIDDATEGTYDTLYKLAVDTVKAMIAAEEEAKAEQDAAAKVNDDMVVAVVDTEIVTGVKLGAGVSVTEQAAAIKAALEDAGYTEVAVVIEGGEVTAASGKLDGITVNFTVNEDDATVAAPVDSDALAAALADSDVETVVLGSGEYTADLYANANGKKSLTIIGNGDTQIEFAQLQVRAALYDELTIENCKILHMATKAWGHLVFGSSTKAGGVYTIKNCTFEGEGTQGIYINQTVEATFNIVDCTFDGDFGGEGAITIQNNDGVNVTVNVTGCTFENIPETSHEIYCIYAYDEFTLNAEGVDVFWKAK